MTGRWWFAPVPTRRLALVRSLTFVYATGWLLLRGPYVADVAQLPDRRWEPIGLLGPLDSPPGGALVALVWVVTLVACVAAVGNRLLRVATPTAAAGVLLLATYTSSFGQVFHTENLLVVHTVVLAFAALVEPVDLRGTETSGWPLRLMMSAVAVAYVVAGVAKLRYGGIEWVTGDILRNAVAMDNLRKVLVEDWYSPIGGRLASVAWIWTPIAFVTIVVELLAPLALAPGRLRLAWIALAWGFHLGILMLMAISFPYQLFGVAYAAFLPVERIADRVVANLPTWVAIGHRPAGSVR